MNEQRLTNKDDSRFVAGPRGLVVPRESVAASPNGLVVPEDSEVLTFPDSGLQETPSDAVIDDLIALLSRPTQALTTEEFIDSIRQRQEAVNKFLIRGGAETVRKLFERIKQF